jgi:hypothetical protein
MANADLHREADIKVMRWGIEIVLKKPDCGGEEKTRG